MTHGSAIVPTPGLIIVRQEPRLSPRTLRFVHDVGVLAHGIIIPLPHAGLGVAKRHDFARDSFWVVMVAQRLRSGRLR